LTDPYVSIYQGNCLEVMATLPADSVQCVVTSPPYWGLRKYDGEQVIKEWGCAYGLEPTIELYVAHTVEILQAIKRVLRPDGICWFNLGDSYAGSQKGIGQDGKAYGGKKQQTCVGSIGLPVQEWGNLKPKDLCLIPFRVALAAQSDGWYIRSVIIWSKPNPMPESVKDRPTESHEYILMMTKSSKYYFDMEAVREPYQLSYLPRMEYPRYSEFSKGNSGEYAVVNPEYNNTGGRNIRSVWEITTQPFSDAHFATFPEEIPRKCILASTSEKGCCSKCGKPWVRIIQNGLTAHDGQTGSTYEKGTTANRLALLRQAARARGQEYSNESITLGWQPQCSCNAEVVPCTVLDPFGGSGTTSKVAKELNRKSIYIDVSEKYCAMARKRIETVTAPMDLA